LPPYPAERPATSPYRSEKGRKNANMEGNSNNAHPHGIPTSFSQRKANDRSVALKRKSCLSEAKSPFK